MIKTPHRLLHDALSKEDYARVLVNMRECTYLEGDSRRFHDSNEAHLALRNAFVWNDSNETHEHWRDIADKMEAAL